MADITIIKDPAQLDADLTSIGDSIRAKGGTTAKFNSPAEMKAAVDAIQTGGSGRTEQEYINGFADGSFPSGDLILTGSRVRSNAFYGLNISTITFKTHMALDPQAFSFSKAKSAVAEDSLLIYNDAFQNSSLERVQFKGLVKHGQNPFNGLFKNCRKMLHIDIVADPSLQIGAYFVTNAPNLEAVIFRENFVAMSSLASGAFANTGILNGTGYVYVPRVLVEKYKTATNWVQIAAQIRAIEDYPDITGG